MLITYMRSSSYNNFDFCQMQYYINYVLGIPRTAGKKADMGTIVHKVLEILAEIKLKSQTTNDKTFYHQDNEIMGGKILVDMTKFLEPTILTDRQIEQINKTRINKYTYLDPCFLEAGHIRYGVKLVEDLIERVYNYYRDRCDHDWQPRDFKDITNFVWMALDYKDGIVDPRRREIVAAEPHFDFEIDKPWAAYNYTDHEGKTLSGKLGIKGTIDLITKLPGGILEIIDWKTGQRKNWATDREKKYGDLQKDFQLLLYYYAAKRMYPDAEQIMVTIVFVRHGGPFTMCFDEESVIECEDRLRKRFEEIQNCEYPSMIDPYQRSFKCQKLCDYYKMEGEDGENFCKTIHNKLQTQGMEKVTAEHTRKGFCLGTYQAPGEK